MTKSAWKLVEGLTVLREDRLVSATLRYRPWWDAAISLAIEDDVPTVEATGRDLFEALLAARRKLESIGAQLCCVGAELDVWPSGMLRQSGEGNLAYHSAGGGEPPVLVDIFQPTDCSRVVSVDVQSERHLPAQRTLGSDAPDEVVGLAASHGGQWIYEVVGEHDASPRIDLSTVRRSWHVASNGGLDGVWLSNPRYEGPDELGDEPVRYVARPRSPFV